MPLVLETLWRGFIQQVISESFNQEKLKVCVDIMTVKTQPHILVVDDELSMRELLEFLLSREGYTVSLAENGRNAINMLDKHAYDLLLCDIKLGDMTGLDVLKASKTKHPDTTVIMISAFATTETAVEAMNMGAYDIGLLVIRIAIKNKLELNISYFPS